MPSIRAACSILVAVLGAAAMPPAAFAQAAADPYFEFLMARRLEAGGDMTGALAALARAAAADKASAEIRAEIASFQLRQNRRDDAEKAAREALALAEGNLEAHRVLGLVYAGDADAAAEKRESVRAATLSRQAITHLERVGTSPSADIGLHYTLGRLYLRTGAPDKAVQALGRVLTQNPNSVQGRLALAQAHAATENVDAAIDTLGEIVEDEPRVASALAQYQEQAGRFKDAAENYTRALAVTPMSRDLKYRRAAVLFRSGDLNRSAELAAQAQAEHPDDLRFPQLQARALFASGASARALALLETTVKAYPRDVQTQFALADLYNEADRDRDAERAIRQVLQLEPSNADALNYLGYLLAERGEQLDEAIRLVRRALDSDPGNPSYLDSLGWAHFRRGEIDEAEKYLAPAAAKLPRNSVVQDHFGDVQARRGRWQQAIEAWRKALDGDGDDLDRAAVTRKIEDARGKLSR
jgi:tetratricopeptide (TPR) repeat protein